MGLIAGLYVLVVRLTPEARGQALEVLSHHVHFFRLVAFFRSERLDRARPEEPLTLWRLRNDLLRFLFFYTTISKVKGLIELDAPHPVSPGFALATELVLQDLKPGFIVRIGLC
mmetsp:Transcript_19102/g.29287  ORF Transcript_19102/g.29287 Transcript_19102/m.29287 type:complete len:114 (-) Transcript_19102:935-1276(-)